MTLHRDSSGTVPGPYRDHIGTVSGPYRDRSGYHQRHVEHACEHGHITAVNMRTCEPSAREELFTIPLISLHKGFAHE